MNALRRAEPSDAPLLAALHAVAEPPGWGQAAFASLLALPTVVILIAPPTSGFLALSIVAEEAEVLMIAVAPERRRAGVASGLMEAGFALALAAGAERLLLEVAEGNAPARALYERYGFGQIGRRKAYYVKGDAAGQDALVMARTLTPAGATKG